MSYLTITKSFKSKKGKRKSAVSKKISFGPVTLGIIAVSIFCFLSLAFLVQVFQSSTSGYEVADLEERVEQLKDQNGKLEIQAAEMQSLDSIEKSVEQINMVPVEQIVYVERSVPSVVAQR